MLRSDDGIFHCGTIESVTFSLRWLPEGRLTDPNMNPTGLLPA